MGGSVPDYGICFRGRTGDVFVGQCFSGLAGGTKCEKSRMVCVWWVLT
jgi:hypothetical protein